MPSRSPGSGSRAGGNTSRSTGSRRYRLRLTSGAKVPGRACRNSRPSGRRRGLPMPRPARRVSGIALGEAAFRVPWHVPGSVALGAPPARTRARQNRIRTKQLNFLVSHSRKQRRIGRSAGRRHFGHAKRSGAGKVYVRILFWSTSFSRGGEIGARPLSNSAKFVRDSPFRIRPTAGSAP